MTRLIRAEVAKLATTRTFRLLAIGALVLIVAAVTLTALATTDTGEGSPGWATLALAGLAQTFALIAEQGAGRDQRVPAQDHRPRGADHQAPRPGYWPPS